LKYGYGAKGISKIPTKIIGGRAFFEYIIKKSGTVSH